MKRFFALAAPLAAAMLVGCETTTGPTPSAPPPQELTLDFTDLRPAVYPNLEETIPDVTYMALGPSFERIVESFIGIAIVDPESAVFRTPFVAVLNASNSLLVCGSVTASDGGTQHSLVPFAFLIDMAAVARNEFDDVALVVGVGRSILAPGIGVPMIDDAEIRGFCLRNTGVRLPGGNASQGGATAAAPATAPLAPRPR